jgi:hypothetical protein
MVITIRYVLRVVSRGQSPNIYQKNDLTALQPWWRAWPIHHAGDGDEGTLTNGCRTRGQ